MSDLERFPVMLYNSLSRKKEIFKAISPPHAGLYVCGPTVYGDPHLGHARAAITFDLVLRYFEMLGYKVRYVRNITDVGHLENEEEGSGEDKIAKKARLEQVEPMEVVQYYTNRYHDGMDALNCRRPSIEPTATGHIIEQIQLVEKILKNGWAYETDGTVYFDLEKYSKNHDYGTLSGKILEELQTGSRETEGLDEKRSPHDFALWKKAGPEHIMRWESPWGEGFPGWHVECTSMSIKYLGEKFDIHGGGLDLQFPHHEAEIAQSRGANGSDPANFWMHNNMVTIDGAKMSKSAGNFVTLEQLFSGNHPLLEKPYHPMVVRFLMLQSHYRSKIDFSNEALQAAEKGYRRLMAALKMLDELIPGDGISSGERDEEIIGYCDDCYQTMSDDFNTARTLAALFELASLINGLAHGQVPKEKVSADIFNRMAAVYRLFVTDVLGLEPIREGDDEKAKQLIDILIDIRARARVHKDFETADKIREDLAKIGIRLKDGKSGKTTFKT
ncbi:MAG: cysteine--tRNA ligase [Balneolaceae bacterium]